MAGATLTTVQKILKDFYLPTVAEQINNEILLAQRLEPSAEELFGNQAIVALHKARTSGIGRASEGGPLPAAGNQQYERAVFDLIYLYGRLGVTGPGMAKTASQAGAYLQMLKSEMDGLRRDITKDFARQVYGSDLGNGLIAKCAVNTGVTVLALNSDEPLRKGHLHIGMNVDIGSAATLVPGGTPSVAAGRSITDVNVANKTITISGANVTTAVTDFVARAGNGGGEITGLAQIVSTTAGGTVGGINSGAAGNGWWDNLRMMNAGTGRNLSLSLLGQAFGQARTSGADVTLTVGSFGMERQIFELLQGQVRYTANVTELKGGYKALEYQGRPFVADVDAQFGRIYFLTEKNLKVFSNRDWHFLDEDGNVLKWVSGFDMWEAVMARYINLGVTRRNTQLVLGDLNDATGY